MFLNLKKNYILLFLAEIEYQGCNRNFVAENGSTFCTGDRYSLGNANKDKYELQCCDKNNCNTGIYTPSNNNDLTCLGTSGTEALNHVKCASNDSYCLYAAGINDDGKYERFQGCSADFDFDHTICTGFSSGKMPSSFMGNFFKFRGFII
uniref:Uncharacterized protein n=1 Tax=Panagrolaimus sp. PS1159 TaxID=55785 RepID=A0AC35FIW4_9BILA